MEKKLKKLEKEVNEFIKRVDDNSIKIALLNGKITAWAEGLEELKEKVDELTGD